MNKSKLALSFSLVSLLFASLFVLAFAQRPKPTPLPRTIGGEAVVGPSPQSTVALNCIPRGGQFCDGDGFGCLVMFPSEAGWPAKIRKTPEVERQSLSGKAYVSEGSRPSLHYKFNSSPSSHVTIPLDRDIPLDEGVSKSLGYSSVTILKGRYEVDRKQGEFGGLVFDVKVTARIASSPCDPWRGTIFDRTECDQLLRTGSLVKNNQLFTTPGTTLKWQIAPKKTAQARARATSLNLEGIEIVVVSRDDPKSVVARTRTGKGGIFEFTIPANVKGKLRLQLHPATGQELPFHYFEWCNLPSEVNVMTTLCADDPELVVLGN